MKDWAEIRKKIEELGTDENMFLADERLYNGVKSIEEMVELLIVFFAHTLLKESKR